MANGFTGTGVAAAPADTGFGSLGPEQMRALIFGLAGAGRAISQDQGVGGQLGQFAQQQIGNQNMLELIKKLSDTGTQKTGTGEKGAAGDKGKITFEGSSLDDITKTLSGLTTQAIPSTSPAAGPTSTGINLSGVASSLLDEQSNFLMPR